VLSHRLGLVPLAINPDKLAWRSVEDPVNESNTVVFKLDITCRRDADGSMVNDKGGWLLCVCGWEGASAVCVMSVGVWSVSETLWCTSRTPRAGGTQTAPWSMTKVGG
jgi:hypothetical protein